MNAEEKLLDAGYDGIKYLTNYSYDDALVGVTMDGQAVYDYNLMIDWLMKEEDWSEDDAIDWINYKFLIWEKERQSLCIVFLTNILT